MIIVVTTLVTLRQTELVMGPFRASRTTEYLVLSTRNYTANTSRYFDLRMHAYTKLRCAQGTVRVKSDGALLLEYRLLLWEYQHKCFFLYDIDMGRYQRKSKRSAVRNYSTAVWK